MSSPLPHSSRDIRVRPPRERWLVIVAVSLAVAGGLRLVDALPPWWLDQPRAPVAYPSVFELERQQRTRLLVPFVFPDSLVWPPSSVILAPGPGRPVQLAFARADGTGTGLLLTQSLDGDFGLPERLVPARPLTAVPLDTFSTAPRVATGIDGDGRRFLQVSEVVDGRRVVLRWYDDDVGPLVRMAQSLRRS